MECKGVGVGLLVNPDGSVGVYLSLHAEEDEDENPEAFVILPVERAAQLSSGLMARAMEGKFISDQIAAMPPDDREAGINAIIDRMSAGTN